MHEQIYSRLPDLLLPWYQQAHRELPWRQDRDPYHIWLSEIMLQQTRVEAVKGYYSRFLSALPTVEALAGASDDQLHKLWEGLGYYSRVRNLKKAAVAIMERYGGSFPRQHSQVLALPGIGAYTAGAICSIAFDQPEPAVDGNVLRLAARLTDDHTSITEPAFKKKVQKELKAVYPAQAGDFTQALMELGATLCGPNRKPDCENCPCNGICLGFLRGEAESLPVRPAKKPRRIEKKTVFILRCEDRYALSRRPEKGLLAGLWQFPNTEGKYDPVEMLNKVEELGFKPREIIKIVERKHIFTHVEWEMSGVYMDVADMPEPYTWLTGQQIGQQAALPTAFRLFWEEENV